MQLSIVDIYADIYVNTGIYVDIYVDISIDINTVKFIEPNLFNDVLKGKNLVRCTRLSWRKKCNRPIDIDTDNLEVD